MNNNDLNNSFVTNDTSKSIVREILDVLVGQGVEDIVISPGSRNAPIISGAVAREALRKHVAVDERSAAFMALGMASVAQKPVALVCTSGTALLNYAPAVAEAYYQGIPLIVLSADRPIEWIDQDDSQTIRQHEALRNFVKGSYDISDKSEYDGDNWYANRIANDALLNALADKQGPVHINIHLSNPLNGLDSEPHIKKDCRIIRRVGNHPLPEKAKIRELATDLLDKKVMITVGFNLPDARLNRALLKLRNHPNVSIMAETISNTHLPQEDYMVDSVLCTLTERQKEDIAPDVVISIGGALISRMLKDFLRKNARSGKMDHWSVGPTQTTVDCFQTQSLRIDADPAIFFSMLSAEMAHLRRRRGESWDSKEYKYRQTNNGGKVDSRDYNSMIMSMKNLAMRRVFNFAGDAPWSDLVAFIDIFNNIPSDYNLFLSNGTSVRYAQIIPYELPHASYCNRGVSGIEGSTSAAVGGALIYNGPSLLITGDMSLSHDLGGLALAQRLNPNLKIIVINNEGGGIFRFVKATASLPSLEEYFCADPQLPIAQISSAFGFSHQSVSNLETLREGLEWLFSNKGRAVLEVKTPAQKSALLLKQFLKMNQG